MQKSKKHPAARKATAGKTGTTSTRKPLTPEQRARKNKYDRERKALIREMARKNKQADSDKQTKQDAQKKCGHGCSSSCGSCGPRFQLPPLCKAAAEVIGNLGRKIVEQAKAQANVPVKVTQVKCETVQVEPGVEQNRVTLPNGDKVAFTVVDGEKVNPLSDYSPIPYPVRRQLLLARMAKEVCDIVDSNIAGLS